MPDISALKDSIARRSALLDQLKAELEQNRSNLTEEQTWWAQAQIDERSFSLEIDKLEVAMSEV